ncbi:MAG: tetratricopeptide repeat protein [bacterium]
MKRIILLIMIFLALTVSGCTGGGAEELFETARFEELQNSHDHAKKLYQEIIDKYPESDYAKKARERLNQL